MKSTKKWLAGVLAALMVLSLAACGPKDTLVNTGSPVTYPEDGSIYPVQCEDTLTVWGPMQASLLTKVTNFGETPYAIGLEERTGVKIEYIHPAGGNIEEQLNLLLASGDLPDILGHDWTKYGAESAIENGYILNLNQIIDQWAPNLKNLLTKDRPEYDKMVKTDNGNYYVFPSFRESSVDCIYQGPVIRKDWLDAQGLAVPETIDEWETVLTTFKDKYDLEAPLSLHFDELGIVFAGAFGAYGGTNAFYMDGKKLVYGPVTDEWKAYLTKMNDWYNKGLLDKNVATFDWAVLSTNILNDRVGATFAAAASGVGAWTTAKAGTSFELVGAKYPVINKGDTPEFGAVGSPFMGGTAITGKCKNPELAARWLDYGFSEEGRMYNNFGTEGVSYEMVDGEPKFTDAIVNSPEGISPALMMYAKGSYSGTFMQDGRVVAQMQAKPAAARAAVVTWAENNMEDHLMPLITPTIEEQSEVSNLRSELDTYVQEMTLKFIIGQESLDKWDEYVANVEKFGLERLMELYKGAISRYNKR